jgi:hypothetical protein
MMRIKDIEAFFEANVLKKTLKEISWYEEKENNIVIRKTLVNSLSESFDFDEINKTIKTSDTLYFKEDKVVFVEFKSGKIPTKDLRLKAIESIISFYNYIYSNGFTEEMTFPNQNFQIYFVYNYDSTPKEFNYFSQIEKELYFEYRHLFSKFRLIDNQKFQKIFRI